MTAPLVILQARTGSRRLPAKSLITFRGMPLALLAIRRASTRGHNVVLATSNHSSDDVLVAAAEAQKIPHIRGPLDDVLARFCQALGTVADSTIVLRLTGDNIVPDGDLISEVVEAFKASNANYMTTGAAKNGLPYGVAIEAMYAGDLRCAQAEATTIYEREHVTPWIRKHLATAVFDRYKHLELDRFRLTIDTLDDLLSMDQIFPKDGAPDEVPWMELVKRAYLGNFQPTTSSSCDGLVLGTAQLGMIYGVNNSAEIPSDVAQDIIREAIANGVLWLDTARAYGRSEQVVGSVLSAGWDSRCKVITKVSPLTNWHPHDQPKGVRAAAEASLFASCHALGQKSLDTVILHRQVHWHQWGGAIADLLREWVTLGRIHRLGVSVQSPEELALALEVAEFSHIQMPCNILDHRWENIGVQLEKVRRERFLTVHVRSTLLQGLLLSDDPQKWCMAGHKGWVSTRNWLTQAAHRFSQADVSALCLNWARALPWADGVVVGVDNQGQLRRNLSVFSNPPLPYTALEKLANDRPRLTLATLDPARWKHAL